MPPVYTLAVTHVRIDFPSTPMQKAALTFKLKAAKKGAKPKVIQHYAKANVKDPVSHNPLVFSTAAATVETILAPPIQVYKDIATDKASQGAGSSSTKGKKPAPWSATEWVTVQSPQKLVHYTKAHIATPAGHVEVDVTIWLKVVAPSVPALAPIFVFPGDGPVDASKPVGSVDNPLRYKFASDWTAIYDVAFKGGAFKSGHPRPVHFKDGTYRVKDETKLPSTVWLRINRGGSPGHKWLLKSVNKHGARIVGNNDRRFVLNYEPGSLKDPTKPKSKANPANSGVGRQFGISFGATAQHGGASHVVLDGFHFERVTHGIYMNSAEGNHHISILNVRISNVMRDHVLNLTDIPGGAPFFQGIHSNIFAHDIHIERCEFVNMGLPDAVDVTPWTAPEALPKGVSNDAANALVRMYMAAFAKSPSAQTYVFAPLGVYDASTWPKVPVDLQRVSLSDVGVPRGRLPSSTVKAFADWVGVAVKKSAVFNVLSLDVQESIKAAGAALKKSKSDSDAGAAVVRYIVAKRYAVIDHQVWANALSHAVYLYGYAISVKQCLFSGISRGRAIKIAGTRAPVDGKTEDSLPRNWPVDAATMTIDRCVFIGEDNPHRRIHAPIWLAGNSRNLKVRDNVGVMPQGGTLIEASYDYDLPKGVAVDIARNELRGLKPSAMRLISTWKARSIAKKDLHELVLVLSRPVRSALGATGFEHPIKKSGSIMDQLKTIGDAATHIYLIDPLAANSLVEAFPTVKAVTPRQKAILRAAVLSSQLKLPGKDKNPYKNAWASRDGSAEDTYGFIKNMSGYSGNYAVSVIPGDHTKKTLP